MKNNWSYYFNEKEMEYSFFVRASENDIKDLKTNKVLISSYVKKGINGAAGIKGQCRQKAVQNLDSADIN